MIDFNLGDLFSRIAVADFLKVEPQKRELSLRKQFFPKPFARHKEFGEIYRMENGGSISSYIIMARDEPVYLLEIHEVSKTEFGLYYDAIPGDYCLILFLSQAKKKELELLHNTLSACLKALFDDPLISRIIVPVYEKNFPEKFEPMLIKLGFTFIHKKRIYHPDLFVLPKPLN